MPIKYGVIADDFTGASDTGVQYAKKGLETIVLTNLKNFEQVKEKADVLVIDTESRLDNAEIAYKKVREAAKTLKQTGIDAVYKKIDSTLRGNIGVELDAIMDEFKVNFSVLAPAFPANNRIIIGGYLLIHNIPLGLTEISQDPVTPVKESYVPTLLKNQTQRDVIHIPLATVMDPHLLEEELKQIINARDGGIIIFDTVTQGDLEKIAYVAVKLKLDNVTSGSAGLSEELPKAFGLVSHKPAVLISGSSSEVTFRQIRKVEEKIQDQAIILDVQKIFRDEGTCEKEIQRVVAIIKTAITEGRDSIVASAISKETVEECLQLGMKRGLSKTEISEKIVSTLGEIAYRIPKKKIAGMILTGGATTIAVLEKMDILGVKLIEEVLPGIPLNKIIGSKFDGLKLITKAGAFGSGDALSKSLEYVKRSF